MLGRVVSLTTTARLLGESADAFLASPTCRLHSPLLSAGHLSPQLELGRSPIVPVQRPKQIVRPEQTRSALQVT